MRYRSIEQEDLDFQTDEAAARNLADIARINRFTGARRRLLASLGERYGPKDRFRVLDVGAASGDFAVAIRGAFPNSEVVCLDLRHRNLRGAPRPCVQGDAFALPFKSRSVDVVHASLFLHHFDDEAAGRLILEMHRVARGVVMIQDLHRHWLAYYFLPLTQSIFGWDPLTVTDGMKSVAAGWRRKDLKQLLTRLGLIKFATIEWHFPSFRYFIAISGTDCDAFN